MEVDTLCKHICGDDDVVVILTERFLIVGIKVLLNGLEEFGAVARVNNQYILAVQTFLEVFNCIF